MSGFQTASQNRPILWVS